MSLAPNLGGFASIAALTTAFAASSVPAGTIAYTADKGQVVSNGSYWAQSAVATELVNFRSSNFPNFRAAMAKMRLGTADPLVVVLGDSTTAGYAGSYTGSKATASTAYLGQILTKYGIPASEEIGNIANTTASPVYLYDSRLSQTGFTSYPATSIGGALMTNSVAGTGTLNFAPTRSFDSFDIIWYSTSCTAAVKVDSGSTLATLTGSANVLNKTTVSCTAGTHTINIVVSAGTIYVAAIIPHTSTARQINILNNGYAGSHAYDWSNTASGVWQIAASTGVSVPAPNLAIIELTVNDAIYGASPSSSSSPSYNASMTTLISNFQTNGCDVILSTGNPTNNSTNIANLPAYLTALYALANTYNCALLDMNQGRYVSYAATNPSMAYYDTIHFTSQGYADKAEAYAYAIRAAVGS